MGIGLVGVFKVFVFVFVEEVWLLGSGSVIILDLFLGGVCVLVLIFRLRCVIFRFVRRFSWSLCWSSVLGLMVSCCIFCLVVFFFIIGVLLYYIVKGMFCVGICVG